MELRTHYLISKTAARRSGFDLIEQTVFCIGSLIPDLSTMQFIHRHFYNQSAEYVFSKIERLSGKGTLLSILELGKTAHYISDLCCPSASAVTIQSVSQKLS